MNLPDLTLPDPALPDERLEAWLDGALPEADAEAVAALVASDAAWGEAAATARRLRRMLVTAPVCPAPPGFEAAVLARIAASPARRPDVRAAAPHARPRMRWARIAAPLMLVLLVGLATWRPFRPADPSAAEVAEARRQVEYTLALLSDIGAQAGQHTAASLAPFATLDTLTTTDQ